MLKGGCVDAKILCFKSKSIEESYSLCGRLSQNLPEGVLISKGVALLNEKLFAIPNHKSKSIIRFTLPDWVEDFPNLQGVYGFGM